jgi:hypothetical protein
MTGSSATESSTPDVGAAVHALKPQLTRISVVALIFMIAFGIAGTTGMILSIAAADLDEDRFKFVAVAAILGVGGIVFTFNRMRRAQEALVMPIVAAAVGLAYNKDAKQFLKGLPDRLLPGQSVKSAEDFVTGQLGNHTIQMAEVKVETGGKNSRTLFKGVVARFPNSIAMPAFFLAPKDQTKPGMIFKAWIPTDGLYHLRDITGPAGGVYGLWTPWNDRDEPPALSAVVDILTSLQTRLDVPMTLFTATSDGTEMHLALDHKRNLFSVGGLFQDDSQLFSDVFAATRDLSVPLNLVRELVAAEVAAAEKVKAG